VNEPDPEKRYKLEAGLKGVGGMTRDVLVDVVAAAIGRSTDPLSKGQHAAEEPVNWGHR
jgi:hypothetical protein